MAILTPALNTTQLVGPFNTLADYDLVKAWFDAATPAALLARGITGYVGDPEALTIAFTVPTKTASINTANPL